MSLFNIKTELRDGHLDANDWAFNVPAAGGRLLAWGTTVPTDADAGYATGCIFIHTDGGDGTSLYVNEGSATSCNFNAITVGA